MKHKNYTKKLLVVSCSSLLLFACNSDDDAPPAPVALDIQTELVLNYGEEAEIDLSGALSGQSDISVETGFEENANLQISSSQSLQDKLAEAVIVRTDGDPHVHINSALLYPNGAVSTADGSRIPDDYRIAVIAKASDGTVVGQETVSVTVNPGTISIKEAGNNDGIPFAYALYSNDETHFELESPAIPANGTTWYLPETGGEVSVSLEGDLITFAGTEGNPTLQEEVSYDLEPALLKDGFPVASTPFRVIFIPQIKFFYGMYFPEDDMSIHLDFLHFALTGGSKTSAPAFYPAEYKSTFEIVSIKKDGELFDDTHEIFGIIEDTGEVTTRENDTLTPGQYELTIRAVSTTGLELTTTLTLAMESY